MPPTNSRYRASASASVIVARGWRSPRRCFPCLTRSAMFARRVSHRRLTRAQFVGVVTRFHAWRAWTDEGEQDKPVDGYLRPRRVERHFHVAGFSVRARREPEPVTTAPGRMRAVDVLGPHAPITPYAVARETGDGAILNRLLR